MLVLAQRKKSRSSKRSETMESLLTDTSSEWKVTEVEMRKTNLVDG